MFPPHYSVEHLTVNDGLSENNIWSIIQDDDGFIWIGSFAGINRYDGYNILTIGSSDSALLNVASKAAGGFARSRDPRYLWVSSELGFRRLDRWALRLESFPQFHASPNNQATLSNDNVQCLLEDSRGTLWIGTADGLNSYDVGLNRLKRHALNSRDPKLPNHHVYTIFEDRRKIIWVGVNAGLYTIERETGVPIRKFSSVNTDSTIAIVEDSSGNLWVGTLRGDVFVFDSASNLIAQFAVGSEVFALCAKDSGRTWCGTSDGRLLLLDRRTRTSRGVGYDDKDNSTHAISTLFKDRSDVLWIGTFGRGVRALKTPRQKFETFRFSRATRATTLAQGAVWSTLQSHDGTMWIGTRNTLCRLDTVTGEYREVEGAPRGKQVRALLEDGDDLWLGLLDGGLARWNRRTNRWAYHRRDIRNPQSLSSDLVYALHKDKSGTLWVGTNIGCLDRFDLAAQTFASYAPSEKLKWVMTIHEDSGNTLWLGMWNGGLGKFDKTSKKFDVYSPNFVEEIGQSRDRVSTIIQPKHNTNILWLGTLGGGLLRFEKSTKTFLALTENDGLSNNSIYGMLEDDFGNLWLSTNKGISRFDPQTNAFTNFDVNDGLQGNEFNLGSYGNSVDGSLHFGGDFGVNGFHPSADVNRHPPEVVLTRFTKFNTSVELATPVNQQTEISLDHTENVIGFTFTALHFQHSLKNQYAYKLEGYDADWIRIGTKREAGFVNLQPGDYVFKVKAANSDGVWSKPKEIRVHIGLPIWKAWWFHLFWVGFLGLAGYAWHRGRIYQAIQLERMRRNEEDKLRQQLQDDVHDYVSGHAARISQMSRELKHEHTKHLTTSSLSSIAEHAESLLRELGNIQWALDPNKNSLFDLVARLQNTGNALFAEKGIVFRIAGVDEGFEKAPLPLEWRKELLLLFHEAMNNIVKHADGCENVTLSAEVKGELLVMCLSNDGDGFEESECARKNGLQHMRDRAERLNGELQVHSTKQNGTVICFIGKLPSRRV